MHLVHHNWTMKLDVRKTTPFTTSEDEQLRAFGQPGSWQRRVLERLSPVPLREGSEGAVVRALALLGMAYVREHAELGVQLAAGYDELAAARAEQETQPAESARTAGLRANMGRRASRGPAASPR